jgi:hypothetical protein
MQSSLRGRGATGAGYASSRILECVQGVELALSGMVGHLREAKSTKFSLFFLYVLFVEQIAIVQGIRTWDILEQYFIWLPDGTYLLEEFTRLN